MVTLMGKKMLDLLTLTCSKISLPFSISKPLELHQSPPALGPQCQCSAPAPAPQTTVGRKEESPGFCHCCRVTGRNLAFSISLSFPSSQELLVFIQRRSKAQRWVVEVRCWDLGWEEGIQSIPFLLMTENTSTTHPGHLNSPRNLPQFLPSW